MTALTQRALNRPAMARGALVIVACLTPLAAVESTAPLVTLLSGVCLFFMIIILWRGDEPPILLLPVLFQWSEVTILPLSTIWRHVPLDSLSRYGANMEGAAIYGLMGVGAMASGLRLGAGDTKTGALTWAIQADVSRWTFGQVGRWSLFAAGIGYAAGFVQPYAGAAAETLNQVSAIKYAGLFTFTYWCLRTNSHLPILAAVLCFEIGFGLTGFFAGFKNSILTLLLAAMAARPKLRLGDMAVLVCVTALLLTVASFWSYVKEDYRAFLNKGTGSQVVLVPIEERTSFIANAASQMSGEKFNEGFNRLVDRHGYIEFLGLTMENVPSRVPHEYGNITLGVASHIAMPRLLFPDKPALIGDTEIMARYTGLVNSWNDSTSISIGFLGELYVDFGYAGGIVAAGAIGLIFGLIYRLLRGHEAAPPLLNVGLLIMVALPLAYFGTSYVKLFAGGIYCTMIAFGLQRFGLPYLLPIIVNARRRRIHSVRRR